MNNNQQKKKIKTMSYFTLVTLVGIFGGLLWGGVYQLCHYLNFTEIGPTFLLRSWLDYKWTRGWMGIIGSILCMTVVSLLLAYLYSLIFKKAKSFWLGIVYGIAVWLIVFLLLRPMFPDMKTVAELSKNTIVTNICIFILYGLFIGYSISFEYQEESYDKKEEEENLNPQT